jgi:hypothetical protein
MVTLALLFRPSTTPLEIVRLETNRALKEAIALYTRSGYVEVDAFSSEPYADQWFEKRLGSNAISSLALPGLHPNGRLQPFSANPAYAESRHSAMILNGTFREPAPPSLAIALDLLIVEPRPEGVGSVRKSFQPQLPRVLSVSND